MELESLLSRLFVSSGWKIEPSASGWNAVTGPEAAFYLSGLSELELALVLAKYGNHHPSIRIIGNEARKVAIEGLKGHDLDLQKLGKWVSAMTLTAVKEAISNRGEQGWSDTTRRVSCGMSRTVWLRAGKAAYWRVNRRLADIETAATIKITERRG